MALSHLIVQAIRHRGLNPVWLHALRSIAARARLDPEYAYVAGGILAGLVPARRAVDLGFIRNTLEQAALSLGFNSMINVARGPRSIAALSIDALRASREIAAPTLQHPFESFKWGLGLATSLVDLAAQVTTDLIESEQR
jgi:hypothetical protein